MATSDDRQIPRLTSLGLVGVNDLVRRIVEMIYQLEGRRGDIELRDSVAITTDHDSILSFLHKSSVYTEFSSEATNAAINRTYFARGASFNGQQWRAEAQTATIIGLNETEVAFYYDSSLTIGAAYVPTRTAGIGSGGISPASSGWTDDGTVVRLTDITDKVGVGTASPSSDVKIDIRDTTATSYTQICSTAAVSPNNFAAVAFAVNTSGSLSKAAIIGGGFTDTTVGTRKGYIAFATGNAAFPAERARITSTGAFKIGTLDPAGTFFTVAATPILVDDTKITTVLGTSASPVTGRNHRKPMVYLELVDNSNITAAGDMATYCHPALAPAVFINTTQTGPYVTAAGISVVSTANVADSSAPACAGVFWVQADGGGGVASSVFGLNVICNWAGGTSINNLCGIEADIVNWNTDSATGLPGSVTDHGTGFWAQNAGTKITSTGFLVTGATAAWRFGYTVNAPCTEWGMAVVNLHEGGHGLAVSSASTTDTPGYILIEAGCGTWTSGTRTCFRVTQEDANPVYIRVGTALRQVTRAAGTTADLGFRALQVS